MKRVSPHKENKTQARLVKNYQQIKNAEQMVLKRENVLRKFSF